MAADTPVTFGPFDLDPDSYRLRRDGLPVPLEPKAIDLLVLLVSRAPRVVDKAEIFSVVWKDVAVTDNALTRIVAQLRKALDDDARAPRYIETVATRGYRFVAEVAPAPAASLRSASTASASSLPPPERSTPLDVEASDAAPRVPEPAPAPAPAAALDAGTREDRPRSARVPLWTLAACAAVLVLAVTAWSWQQRRGGQAPASDRRTSTLATLVPEQVTTGTGYDAFPAYSPDGRSIAFSSDRSGAFEIYVQALVPGATPTALTSRGRHGVHPAWSPDGQFIAYHEMDGGGIWIVPARGGVARRVSDFGSRPAWSPDGAALAFQSMPVTDMGRPRAPGLLSTIWLVDVAGGPPRALAAGRTSGGPQLSPAWTSDGMVLFAESAGDGRTSIWRVGANGTGLQRVATHPRLSPEFAVDPRGRGFYFVALPINAIWWQALGPDGTAAGDPVATGLATSGQLTSKLALAPDGRGLAWTSLEASGHVRSRTLAGNGPAAATALTQGLRVRYSVPAAARDGRIALTGSRTGAASILYVLDPGRGLRPVTVDDHPHANPQWLPDEREVAFLTDAPAAAFGAVDVETGRERVLFPLSALPLPTGLELFNASLPNNVVAAPDFSRLAMTLLKGGVPNVWVAEIRDGAPRGPMVQRTFETEGGSYPAWSPDGRWIAYQCLAEGMITHVCVADAETGARRQLTAEPGQSWIGGWVDDDGILFAAQRHGVWNVMQVSRTTGQVHAVTADAVPRTYVRYPRWDAVGRRVIFERGEYTARVFRVTLSE